MRRSQAISASIAIFVASAAAGYAQPTNLALQPPKTLAKTAKDDVSGYAGAVPAAELLRVPVTEIVPGNVKSVVPQIRNPLANDPDAVVRGMRDFDTFNCSGCHAANGAGGMGPALSNNKWIYGSSPANIYLDIVQGRAHGMPAWGAMLPDRTIWELVAYIKSISNEPNKSFGKTISVNPPSPTIEQVPVEKVTSPTPWQYTEKFSEGQRP